MEGFEEVRSSNFDLSYSHEKENIRHPAISSGFKLVYVFREGESILEEQTTRKATYCWARRKAQ